MPTIKEKIALAQAELKATIKALEVDGLTEDEKVEIAEAKAAFQKFKDSLAAKKADKTPPDGVTSPTLKLPSIFPKLTFSENKDIEYKFSSTKKNLHDTFTIQTPSIPICTGLSMHIEGALKTEAELSAAIMATYIQEKAGPENEFESYQFDKSYISGKVSTQASVKLALTDSLQVVALKSGVKATVDVGIKFTGADLEKLFTKGEIHLKALVLSCNLEMSLGAGQLLNKVYKEVYEKDCPNICEWAGKKYALFNVEIKTIERNGKIYPPEIKFGEAPGMEVLKEDIRKAYEDAKSKLEALAPEMMTVAVLPFGP